MKKRTIQSMNNSGLVNCHTFIFADGAIFAAAYKRGKTPVQELGGQRGEGTYFQRGLIFRRIRY